MSGIEIVVVRDNSDEFYPAMKQRVATGLEAIGIQGEGYAKDMCPVLTGRLRSSITHDVDVEQMNVAIGTNVEYGIYQELGTSRISAANGGRGFLRPAITDHTAVYRELLKRYLAEA